MCSSHLHLQTRLLSGSHSRTLPHYEYKYKYSRSLQTSPSDEAFPPSQFLSPWHQFHLSRLIFPFPIPILFAVPVPPSLSLHTHALPALLNTYIRVLHPTALYFILHTPYSLYCTRPSCTTFRIHNIRNIRNIHNIHYYYYYCSC